MAEKQLTLFLGTLRIQNHLLLSLNKTTDSASCCVVEPSAASSGEMDGDGATVAAGGVARAEAFGAERRGLSGLLSERSFGAALTAGSGGSSGGSVGASVISGG